MGVEPFLFCRQWLQFSVTLFPLLGDLDWAQSQTEPFPHLGSRCQCLSAVAQDSLSLGSTHTMHGQWVDCIRPQRGIGPQPDKPEPPPSSHWKTRGTLMVNSESGHEEESGREGKMVLIWSSLKLHNTYSDFIRGQRWSLMSAALAVIGVTVFVCLTLCKRGLGSGGWRYGKRGGGGGEDTKRKREFWTLPVRLWHCSMDKSMSKRNHCFK